tara:strand:- start:918 stop:2930 length:2013 start_codon:yes stop_codon:yes gene_type:complete
MDTEDSEKTKVGLVQINNSFDGQSYFPLSIGYLHSHAKRHASNFDDFEFLTPIYKRMAVDDAVERLSDADLVGFSTYVWNFEISLEIARRLKERNSDVVTLFGGCHVPDTKEKGLEDFLRKNDFVDVAATGEGERVFTSFLENSPNRDWQNVPSLAYLDSGTNLVQSRFVQTPLAGRIEDLNEIPSPYLRGYFDSLIEENPDEGWIGLLETNRGCPFSCRFCDWGNMSKKRMGDFDLEGRIFKEIDWFSDHEVEFVYCCDSNYGMFTAEKFGRRDLRIAKRFAENKTRTGFPNRFSVQNTKNSTEASYEVQTVLNQSGLDKGVLLAFQSLHEPTLEAVGRGNIKLSTFHDLQRRFTSEGIETFSDLILGLPEETYDSFTDGVSTLIELGQHNGIQMNNLSILPNAPMMEDVDKYSLEIVGAPIVNIHGSLEESEEVPERQQLVVGTNTMPREDWRKTRSFTYMAGLLHFGKLTQVPDVILNSEYGISYKDTIDAFVNQDSSRTPVLSEISSLFSDHARKMQEGGPEYIPSTDMELKMWWPPNEYALIKLVREGNIDKFYDEAEQVMSDLLKQRGEKDYEAVLHEVILFNREMIRLPFQTEDLVFETEHNILEVYRAGLVKEKKELRKSGYKSVIDRISKKWDSVDDWAREVVWWGHKKGDYAYPVKSVNE